MKKHGFLLFLCLVPVLFCLFLFSRNPALNWEPPDALPRPHRNTVSQGITSAASLLMDAQLSDVDAMESRLSAAGLPVLDTDAIYPEYLTDPQPLLDFYEAATSGLPVSFSCYRILSGCSFRQLYFWQESGSTYFCSADVLLSEDTVQVTSCTVMPVLEMSLSDWDIFYYRLYPAGDPHYIDYSQIRLSPVDPQAYDLTRTYILPIGYQLVNLFLVDWQEGDWGELSFPDLLESFYLRDTGEDFPWETYVSAHTTPEVRIPASQMEQTILPYFSIDLQEFRTLCQYDPTTDTYPWWPIHGDDLTPWHYPMCEPLVTDWAQNPDGTLTLSVQVYSPDQKTDDLFRHEVTVRPFPEGTFQYVRNRVTFVSAYGLPPAQPRSQLHRITPFQTP